MSWIDKERERIHRGDGTGVQHQQHQEELLERLCTSHIGVKLVRD
jgi:hypothetical protein